MARFIVKSTQAVWATWSYEIDAESAEAAEKKFMDGDHDADPVDGPEIGDNLDGYDLIVEVEAVTQ